MFDPKAPPSSPSIIHDVSIAALDAFCHDALCTWWPSAEKMHLFHQIHVTYKGQDIAVMEITRSVDFKRAVSALRTFVLQKMVESNLPIDMLVVTTMIQSNELAYYGTSH